MLCGLYPTPYHWAYRPTPYCTCVTGDTVTGIVLTKDQVLYIINPMLCGSVHPSLSALICIEGALVMMICI